MGLLYSYMSTARSAVADEDTSSPDVTRLRALEKRVRSHQYRIEDLKCEIRQLRLEDRQAPGVDVRLRTVETDLANYWLKMSLSRSGIQDLKSRLDKLEGSLRIQVPTQPPPKYER